MPLTSQQQESFTPAPTMNLQSIGQEALKLAESVTTEPTATVVAPTTTTTDAGSPTLSTTPEVTQTVAGDQNSTPAISPAEQKLYDLDLGNGRVEKLTEAQIKDAYLGGLRLADYTKKTTEAATMKREAQQLLQQAKQQEATVRLAEQLVNNPQLAWQMAQQRQTGQPQTFIPQQPPAFQQPIDPSTPVTYEQTYALANGLLGRIQQLEQGLSQREQAMGRIVEDRLEVANYAETINTTLGSIYTKHPELRTIPEIEDIMRFRVAKMEPETLEEAQKAFESVAGEISEKLGKPFNDRHQSQQVARQTLVKQGIEPPGGSAPQPTKESFNDTNGKIDWKKLKTAALNMGQS